MENIAEIVARSAAVAGVIFDGEQFVTVDRMLSALFTENVWKRKQNERILGI